MILQNCTEEQRPQYVQQLQTLAHQGEAQAVSALSSLMGGGDMTNATDGSNQVIVMCIYVYGLDLNHRIVYLLA